MKKLSLFWRIIIGLVLVLGVTTLVLGLIPLKNAPDLATDKLITMRLSAVGSNTMLTLKDEGTFADRFNNIKKEYNAMKKFSVLRGILVGQVSGMDVSDEDVVLTPNDISNKKADATNAMVWFVYEDMQSTTIEGVTFHYNEAKILVSDTASDIGTFTVILFDSSMLANASGDPADEDYEVRTITCRGNGTRLIEAIDAAIANELE